MRRHVEQALRFFKRQPRWRLAGTGIVLLLAVVMLVRGARRDVAAEVATFTVRRGPLDIVVLEGGSVQALEAQEVKCRIRAASTKIVRIVEEGYLVTEEDVKNKKVLVELDTGELERQIVQQDISYENARAALVEAQEAYAIQMSENLSNIKLAEQKARFARLDFDKYLGTNVAQQIIEKLGLEKELAAIQTNIEVLTSAILATASEDSPVRLSAEESARSSDGSNGSAAVSTNGVLAALPFLSGSSPLEAPLVPLPTVDFRPYADLELLGEGEAKQKLRRFAADLQVAEMELNQATKNLEATRRLFEKGFVTKVELARDELALENARLKVLSAQTARELFIQYDFTRTAEDYLSRYIEAVRDVLRARRVAISRQAQCQARLRSAQGRFNIESRNRKDLYDQLASCTIVAERPGLVVYGTGREDSFQWGQEPIREGATVRDRQTIITIPDMTKMAVRVKVHESYIKKIQKGQKARITVDAYPDEVLEGEVTKVSVLPDSGNRFLSPDLKLYPTIIDIKGVHEWLKPGMTAKVEIFVAHLPDVIYVPIQAVVPAEDGAVCYVLNSNGKPERRRVEVGENNDEFVEIRSGLRDGERVLLRPLAKAEETALDEGGAAPKAKETSPPATTPRPKGRRSV
ncbi:MAG: HlyD family efflux transporter periplasmic adaptor subunit [Verrucomicrobiae bacterium]|nr:HlyD family efflux transporter periplasmic adaptor subunit [Verrucomicrobiae bacterium]